MANHPTSFATSGYNPARRSILSPAVPAREVDTDFTTSDPQADYLAAQRLGSDESSLSAAFAVITRFGREARTAFPDLAVEVFLVEKSDRSRGTYSPQWGVRASGSALGSARPATQAATPAQALRQLVALVAGLRVRTREARDQAARARRPPPVCFTCRGTLGTTAACPACEEYTHQQAA